MFIGISPFHTVTLRNKLEKIHDSVVATKTWNEQKGLTADWRAASILST
jgi:hypothetical protein